MDEWTSFVHHRVDNYVVQAANKTRNDLGRERIALGIKQMLGDVGSEPMPVFVAGNGETRSVVVVYTLWKCGTNRTSVNLRAYRAADGRVQLTDVTGDSMDEHVLHVVEQLHSSDPGKLLLLLSGQVTTANGPNTGMRIYSFDGTKFRTMWMPENIWGGFTIAVTPSGFTVKGNYYREDRARNDAYFVSSDGIYQVPPQ